MDSKSSPPPPSSSDSSFPILVISILAFAAFLLAVYYFFLVRVFLNTRRSSLINNLSTIQSLLRGYTEISPHTPSVDQLPGLGPYTIRAIHLSTIQSLLPGYNEISAHTSFVDDQLPLPGLDPTAIRAIPTVRFAIIDSRWKECPVCLDEFREEESIRVLPNCSHSFHVECVDAWLTSNNSCPLCRSSIPLPIQSPPSEVRVGSGSDVIVEVRDDGEMNEKGRNSSIYGG